MSGVRIICKTEPPVPVVKNQVVKNRGQPRAPRYTAQAEDILRALRRGGQTGVTNAELAAIALKYTGRISDLRRRGYTITCRCECRTTGLFRYWLGARR